MRYHVICASEDTLTGMRLAGIDGELAHTPVEVSSAIERVSADGRVGILLVTESCAALCRELVNDIKLNLSAPLLVEIPDPAGTARAPDSITRLIRESIGVRLD